MMTRRPIPVRGSHHLRREEGGKVREQKSLHVSVMPGQTLDALALHRGEVVVDATFGAGGHSAAIKKAAKVTLVTLDADPAAGASLTANFGDLAKVLKKEGVTSVDKVLLDLGWNRGQLASGRGFSFLYDEPLSMSYGPEPRSGYNAQEMLNTFSEKVLADIFYGYGEERYARRIAKAVVERRKGKKFETTIELVEVIKDAVPPAYRHGRLHPATRSTTALAIAVNDELRVLEDGLRAAWKLLACKGRIVVITFHSTEDRIVKHLFKEFSGKLVYKKPLVPTATETKENPSARSAKLRTIEKICHE